METITKHYIIITIFWFLAKTFHVLENVSLYINSDSSPPVLQMTISGVLQFFVGLIIIYLMLKALKAFSHSLEKLYIQVPIHLVIFALFFIGITSAGVTAFIFNNDGVSFQKFFPIFFDNYPTFLLGSISSYTVFLGLSMGVFYYDKSQKQEIEKANLENKYYEVKLQSLRSQLNPHLLFNSLNTVVSLIDDYPKKAKNLIVDLSFLLRRLLDSADSQFVTLENELRFLQKYLEIEKARFSDSLKVEIEIEESAKKIFVPSMILQPIVENSLVHGFSNSPKKLFLITIKAKIKDSFAYIEISDNGEGFLDDRDPIINPGVGIKNTKERLDTLYKGKAKYEITCDENGVYNILSFPVNSENLK